jgi:PHD/YefM family antitoxin component YafN of YafNO toxin-antitoxin module
MASISANQLKTKGVSALEPIIEEHQAAVITVRGVSKYVVMDIETYNQLRECELEAAIAETEREIRDGEVFRDTIQEHIKRIADAL